MITEKSGFAQTSAECGDHNTAQERIERAGACPARGAFRAVSAGAEMVSDAYLKMACLATWEELEAAVGPEGAVILQLFAPTDTAGRDYSSLNPWASTGTSRCSR